MAEALGFSASETAAILATAGIEVRAILGDARARYVSAAADSRKVKEGALFVALPGERVDGHDFALATLEGGASCLLLEADKAQAFEARLSAALAGKKAAALLVSDTLHAFQAIARERRRRFCSLKRIGITGSSGKTTTKECVAAALSASSSVVMNPGNLNSDIGLSLSMFEIAPEHEFGVFEMGMNRKGEMSELASIFEPDIALVTNIGTAHIGLIGSRDAIATEKKCVFSRFDGPQVGFVPENDDYNAFLKDGVQGEIFDFGLRSTRGFNGATDLGLDGWAIDWRGVRIRFPLVGKHNLVNGLAALSIAESLGADPAEAARGLESVRPLFGRSEIVRGAVTLVRDCYNSNPDSSEAAMDFCDSLGFEGRRLYVIGSMLELGEASEAAHRRVGEAAARSKADALFIFGEEARPLYEEARLRGFKGFIFHETDIDRLGSAIQAWLRPGDLVLLKASRSVALERVADYIPK